MARMPFEVMIYGVMYAELLGDNTAFHNDIIPPVKHGGGSATVWKGFVV